MRKLALLFYGFIKKCFIPLCILLSTASLAKIAFWGIDTHSSIYTRNYGGIDVSGSIGVNGKVDVGGNYDTPLPVFITH